MLLTIDTVQHSGKEIIVRLEQEGQVIAEYTEEARHSQSEKLLAAIQNILEQAGKGLSDILSIRVNNQGSGFTALRIGVVTANALAYALDVPVAGVDGDFGKGIVVPGYNQEPNITIAKRSVI
jgi:tRNA threonylcarbamoyladenosine biosynthesis protein TsaB